jgi:hypothetical protein
MIKNFFIDIKNLFFFQKYDFRKKPQQRLQFVVFWFPNSTPSECTYPRGRGRGQPSRMSSLSTGATVLGGVWWVVWGINKISG